MKNSEIKEALVEAKKKLAGELEEHLKYKEAIDIWEELRIHKEAKRVRKKIRDEGRVKVDQTVVHGDYVDDRDTTYIDDRDTIVKDSVISKSSIGAGGKSKSQADELHRLAGGWSDGGEQLRRQPYPRETRTRRQGRSRDFQ